MDIKVLVVGALQENCYVCSIGNNAFIVDPGDEADRIIDACNGKNVVEIIVTHHHFDHIGALDKLKEYFGYFLDRKIRPKLVMRSVLNKIKQEI